MEIQGNQPDSPDALHQLAMIALQNKKPGDAVGHLEKAVAAAPSSANLFNHLGYALKMDGRVADAIAAYEKSVSLDPQLAEAHYNLGNALKELQRFDDAVPSYKRAVELEPGFADAHYNMGAVLMAAGRLDEAARAYRDAVAVNPEDAEAHLNLGNALEALDETDEAAAAFRGAIKLRPDFAEAHYNLGIFYLKLGEIDAAISFFRRALEADPDFAEAHRDLGISLLSQGTFQEGWAEYEWRFKVRNTTRLRPFPQRPWSGEAVDGKTVLVWSEQGIGDEVLFASMVPDLAAAGANVIFEADPRLVPLFQRSFAGIECIVKEDPPTAISRRDGIDFQAPGGNLGRWLRPNLYSFPRHDSYLVADKNKRDGLRENYLQDSESLLVGISWISKNKLHINKMNLKKSMALMELAPLTRIPGVRFVDLQYGDTDEERAQFEDETWAAVLHDDNIDQIADLDAFASQVAAMDLIVSISNATAHFAGALGVPALVMLDTKPLPYWLRDRDDNPWYSSVRLFRQKQAGEWKDVVGRVGNALRAFAATR